MHFRKASTPWRVYDALTLSSRDVKPKHFLKGIWFGF